MGCNLGSGIFNVSGSYDISYSDFARILAIKLCVVDYLVKPVSKAMANSTIFASGCHSSLEIKKIMIMANIKPQLFASIMENIL